MPATNAAAMLVPLRSSCNCDDVNADHMNSPGPTTSTFPPMSVVSPLLDCDGLSRKSTEPTATTVGQRAGWSVAAVTVGELSFPVPATMMQSASRARVAATSKTSEYEASGHAMPNDIETM